MGCTLMVFQPAWNRPLTPCQLSADHMTASQKGATSSDQSAVFMSCTPKPTRDLDSARCRAHRAWPVVRGSLQATLQAQETAAMLMPSRVCPDCA